MSHFSVMVRVPATKRGNLQDAVAEMLDPFCEHENDGRSAAYFEFVDEEDEFRKVYETESVEMIRLDDGTFVYPWDDRFKDKGDIFARPEPPAHLPRVQRPHRERFATFEEFVAEWFGHESRDAEHGRYGHRANPNAKWDYWRTGGRWRGKIPVRVSLIKRSDPGRLTKLRRMAAQKESPHEAEIAQEELDRLGVNFTAGLGEVAWEFDGRELPGSVHDVDFCQIKDVDFERADALTEERVEKFWSEVDGLFSGANFPPFEGPRDALLALGLLECKDEGEFDPAQVAWKSAWRHRSGRFDVVPVLPSRAEHGDIVRAHLDVLRPYACVDADGWHAPGRVGWFGCSTAEADDSRQYAASFREWIRGGDQTDFVVMVDCHI